MGAPRVLKVFVASPDDVAEERNAPAKLLTDINDALAEAKKQALRLKGDPDRLNVLARAEEELARKCQNAKG